MCDEIGNVFDNLDEPLASSPLVVWRSVQQRCPGCNEVLLADFVAATEHDLDRIGLGVNEIETGDVDVANAVRRLGRE